jgi:hypothetical protein
MKKVLAISDLHCGGMSGLLPPNYYNADRDLYLKQSRVQEFVFEYYRVMCKEIGRVDLVICNGDIVEGLNKHGKGKDVLITDMMVQCDIAKTVLSMIDCNHYIFTQGSNYHVNDNPSADEMICHEMNGDWYGWFGDVMVDNITINVQHETSFTKDPSNQFNSQQKDISLLKLQGDDPADIYLRSHIHRFTYTGNSNSMTVTTPCWKGMDGFTSKKSQLRPDNGYVLFNIEGSNYSWDYNIFKIPKYFFTKHNNY